MAFDPDAYLVQKASSTSSSSFDPDAYLQAKSGGGENPHDLWPAIKQAGSSALSGINALGTRPLTDIVGDAVNNNIIQPAVDEYHNQRNQGTGVINSGLAALAKGTDAIGEGASNLAAPAISPVHAYFHSRAQGNTAEDALKDARNVAVLLGAGAVGGEAAGALAKPLGDFAENRAAAALGWTKAARNKFGNEAAQQAGRVGLDKDIVTPLASTGDKLAGMQALGKESGQQIGGVMQRLDEAGQGGINPLDTAVEIKNQLGPQGEAYKQNRVTADLGRVYDNILGDTLDKAPAGPTMSLADSQRFKQSIGAAADFNGLPTPQNSQLRQAYGIVNKQLDNAVDAGAQAVGDSGLLDTLKQARVNSQAARQSIGTLTNKLSGEEGNLQFGITDHIAAAPALAKNGLEGIPHAAALVGVKHAVQAYGNNTAAVMADTAAKYAPMIKAAAARGPQTLAVTNYVISQRDPAYAASQQKKDDK